MAIRGFINKAQNGWLVGAEDKERRYHGPVAEVYAKGGWLYVVTDSHEGVAMINIEALPQLRKALSRISSELKGE